MVQLTISLSVRIASHMTECDTISIFSLNSKIALYYMINLTTENHLQDCKRMKMTSELEIRSVERGICPIASSPRPNCSCNV